MEPSKKCTSTERQLAGSSDAGLAKSPRRQRIIWKIVSGSVLALIAVALVVLWPVFKAAGPVLGTGMALAILGLSLAPLLLLGATLRRARDLQAAENSQLAQKERRP